MEEGRNRDLEYTNLPHFGRHAMSFFLEAMQKGYASKPEKGTLIDLPGSKTIEYVCEKWRVLDIYLTTPQSPFSSGMTCEWYGRIPVFTMQYQGYFEEDALPCLLAALSANYEKGIFHAGRGPELFVHDGYTYINRVTQNDFFDRSACEERIYNPEGSLRGWHSCQSVYLRKGYRM